MSIQLPERIDLGRAASTGLGHAIYSFEGGATWERTGPRTVMGFNIPEWQRGLVWSREQSIRLIESIWRGIPIGTYTYNLWITDSDDGGIDGLLIDGQQRLWAIQQYLTDKFKVYGGYYSDLDEIQKRKFANSHFPCFVTETDNMEYLKGYYNLMNFGGVAHTEGQRV